LRPLVHNHDSLSSPGIASPFSRPPIFSRLFLFPYLLHPTLYEIENGAKQSCVCGRAVG